MKQLCDILRLKRLEKRMTLEDLGKELKFSKQYIKEIEKGATFPSFKFMTAFCNFFKCNIQTRPFFEQYHNNRLDRKYDLWINK